jgi:CBS domain-containing protein
MAGPPVHGRHRPDGDWRVGPLVSERHLGVAVTSTGKTAQADSAYIDAGQTLRQAGHLMRELGVGALEVRGDNGDVQGTISSGMVVRRIAAGGDPKTVTVGEVASAVSARRRAPAGSPGSAARCAAITDRALATIS